MALFGAHSRLTSAAIGELTGANRNTIKVRLRELVASERIRRYGKARATWYGIVLDGRRGVLAPPNADEAGTSR